MCPSQAQDAKAIGGSWLDRGLFSALVLACGVAISPNLADADLWGHVRYGLDALGEGISLTTTYSYTAEGYRWINHENLSELVLALVANTFGGPGLMVIKCLLGLSVLGLIIRSARRQGADLLAVCLSALLISINLTYHWSARPQIFSYVLFAALMTLVMWCFQGWQGNWYFGYFRKAARATDQPPTYESWRMRWLWLAPVILCIWANTHGGFVAGLCIYILLLLCRSFEAVASGMPNRWDVVRRFMLMIVVAILATMINPYGPELHHWLLQSLGRPRPEIAEWHPPELLSTLTLPLLALTSLCLLSVLFSRRALDFTCLVVLGVTLWQSFEHQRHVPFFAILFGFWMIPHVDSLLTRLRGGEGNVRISAEMTSSVRRILAVSLCVVHVILIGRLYQRLSQLEVHRDMYPVSAFQYMADRDLRGKLVVTYNWAQYAIAAFGRDAAGNSVVRVGFDGRFRTCYPQEIVDMHFDFMLGNGGPDRRWRSPGSPSFDDARVLEYQQPDLVLISRHQTHAVSVMERHVDDWVLLYQDRLAQLWGRTSTYDSANSPRYILPKHRQISDRPQNGVVSWPAMPEFGRRVTVLADAANGPPTIHFSETRFPVAAGP